MQCNVQFIKIILKKLRWDIIKACVIHTMYRQDQKKKDNKKHRILTYLCNNRNLDDGLIYRQLS